MVRELRLGTMELLATQAHFTRAKNMARADSIGRTALTTMETLLMVSFKALASTTSPILIKSTKENSA